jgi:hypothetical protein
LFEEPPWVAENNHDLVMKIIENHLVIPEVSDVSDVHAESFCMRRALFFLPVLEKRHHV